MRPYLAILKDSFREALASRVLWVMLAIILLFLLAVAPLGFRKELTGEFTWGDIQDGPQLVAKLRTAGQSQNPSPGKRIWALIDMQAHERLARLERASAGENREFFQGMDTLRDALNKLVRQRDLYRKEDWQGVSLPKEAQEFLARPLDQLTANETQRLNRLLIESSSKQNFRPRAGTSICIAYFWLKSDPLPFSKSQIDSFLKEIVLTTAMGWIVGVFGMIAAILVTSTIIPQMFDPGSITLLLSKPISRSLLLVTKILGGCAFILLNVTLLIGGLWLIAGLRLGIWNQGMLWCIPVFLFMFLVYYSVSAFTGLIWKSAVISVVLTVAFWALCFVLDLTQTATNSLLIEPRKITRMADANGVLLAANESGQVLVWDEAGRQWRTVHEPARGRGLPTVEGPYYHPATSQMLVGLGYRMPFGGFGSSVSLRIGKPSDGWSLKPGPEFPSGTAAFLLENDGSLLAVAADDIHRLQGKPGVASAPVRILGVRMPFSSGGGQFKPTLADGEIDFADPLAAAVDPQGPRLIVACGNKVRLFRRQEKGQYAQIASRELTGQDTAGSAVAIAGKLALVAREDGKIWLLSADDGSVVHELTLEQNTQPRFVAAALDSSRFAILFQNGSLWLIDAQTGAARLAPIGGQGGISGFAFAQDRLLVGDRSNRVVEYELGTLARRKIYAPAMSRWELAYYYAIEPLHLVSPKPRMLGNTVQYVLTGKRTTDVGLFEGMLQQKREDLHPWRPIYSGLAFVAVMLLAASIYIERHEF